MSNRVTSATGERWHYRRSLASRVTLLTTIAVGLAVTFVALGAYLTARVQLRDTLDESLLERAQAAAQATTLQELTVSQRYPSWALGAADIRIAFIATSGGSVSYYGPALEIGKPEIAVAAGHKKYSLRTTTADGVPYRVVAVPAAGKDQALIIGQSLRPTERVLTKLGIVSLLFGLAGVIAAGAAGWAVARNGLRPVRQLTAAAEEIALTEDLRPIPVEGHDEVARLSAAFNQMLTSLAASRDRQRRLVADAGHELRTPLTSLRTNLDLLAQAGDGLPQEARDELLDDVRAQIEELSTLVGDLVELARDEPLAEVIESVELTEILDNAVARVRRRASSGVSIEVDAEPWTSVGDPGGIERAYMNVLDNAVKWSPADGVVRVQLRRGILTVDDEGPGIAEEDLTRIFERFWRAEESRSMPGSGLGLSIVAQTAQRHGGSARAQRSPSGGARLIVTLPGDPG